MLCIQVCTLFRRSGMRTTVWRNWWMHKCLAHQLLQFLFLLLVSMIGRDFLLLCAKLTMSYLLLFLFVLVFIWAYIRQNLTLNILKSLRSASFCWAKGNIYLCLYLRKLIMITARSQIMHFSQITLTFALLSAWQMHKQIPLLTRLALCYAHLF